MPTEERGSIGMIKPSGWHTVRYDDLVDGKYLYNRCHLIGYQLTGENANEKNLVTGTRYLNVEGMLPFEDEVADYIKSTGNHVLYRVTPIFSGDNLVCSGVQMEAYSVEDSGKGICFNVYCYNVQPGVSINYATGMNEVADEISNADNCIPFAVTNPSDDDPDLIYEVNKHLEILFGDQRKNYNYTSMMNEIGDIATEARMVGDRDENEAQRYMKLKEYEYKYLEVLKIYVPKLLEKEEFFSSTFK